MAEEAFAGNKDVMSLPHPHSTVHLPLKRERIVNMEQLLGDEDVLQGE